MARRENAVIGGSKGAIESATQTVHGLSDDCPDAVFVVVHFPGSVTSALLRVLNRPARCRQHTPRTNRQSIRDGSTSPPDCHLFIEDGTIRRCRGPKENGHRRGIDPLFRSAAPHYGSRVIGLLLSGNLSDGTAGLLSIKQHGGTAMVQDPEGALYSGMPRSAIRRVPVDHVVPVQAMAGLLEQLTAEPSPPRKDVPWKPPAVKRTPWRRWRSRIGKTRPASRPPCPAPSAMVSYRSSATAFRCRVGHAFTEEALLAIQAEQLGAALWTPLRALEEHSALSRRLAARAAHGGHSHGASTFTEHAMDAEHHASTIRVVLSAGIRGKVTAAGVLEHNPES